MLQFAFVLACLCAFVVSVPLHGRDVFVPPILYPNNSTVWKAGSRHNVTWSIEKAPSAITNRRGVVVFVQDGRLKFEQPLARNFSILDARIEITVPNVKPGPYQIVLFGDSGNVSPTFQIVK